MLLEFLEAGNMIYLMVVLSAAGVLSKLLANGRYRKLIKQSENMGNAKDKYLKQWKVKFENTYRSNSGVNNIPVYIEKNMRQYRFMGIRLIHLDRLNRLAAALLVLGGMTAAFMTYWYAGMTKTVVLYGAAGVLLGGAMLLWETFCNTPDKAGQLIVCIRDYFENTLVGRLEFGQAELVPAAEAAAASAELQEKETPERLRKKEEAAGREQDEEFLRKRLGRIAAGRRSGGRKLTKEEEHLIEDIIQEYLYE